MTRFLVLLGHEMRLQARHRAEWASLVLFFAIVVILMPFALGPEPDILRRLAPGLIWLATLLMSLLSLDRLFVADARDGTLDIMLAAPGALETVVAAKIAAQTASMLAALAVMVLPAALLLTMDGEVLPVLAATLILGVPVLAALGGIAGAITVALNRNPALLTLLLIPFYIPVLIFAVSACDGDPVQPLLFLGALAALVLPAAPFVVAAALRQGQG